MNLPILSNALAQFLYGKTMASIPLLNRVSRGIEFPLKGKIISKLIPNVFYVFLMFLGLFASALANFPKTKKNGSVYYRAHLTFSSPEPPKIRYRGGQVLEPRFLAIPMLQRPFQSWTALSNVQNAHSKVGKERRKCMEALKPVRFSTLERAKKNCGTTLEWAF